MQKCLWVFPPAAYFDVVNCINNYGLKRMFSYVFILLFYSLEAVQLVLQANAKSKCPSSRQILQFNMDI